MVNWTLIAIAGLTLVVLSATAIIIAEPPTTDEANESYPYSTETLEYGGELTVELLDQRTLTIGFEAHNESNYRCAYRQLPARFENETVHSLNHSRVDQISSATCGIDVRRWSMM